MRLHWLIVVAINFLIVGCVGSIDAEKPTLIAKIRGCSVYEISEFSSNVYIVISQECASPSYEIQILNGDDVSVLELSLQDTKGLNIAGRNYKISLFKENIWRKIENSDSWSHRDGAGVVVFNGKIYLLGGWNHETTVNEVWVSDDLFEWTQLPNSPWPPRHGAGWLTHKGKSMLLAGT